VEEVDPIFPAHLDATRLDQVGDREGRERARGNRQVSVHSQARIGNRRLTRPRISLRVDYTGGPHVARANPKVDEAHHRVPPAGFKDLVTERVGWATGGPQRYTGRSMAESHRDLGITPVQSTYGDIVLGGK
jgi:hypothetical protein